MSYTCIDILVRFPFYNYTRELKCEGRKKKIKIKLETLLPTLALIHRKLERYGWVINTVPETQKGHIFSKMFLIFIMYRTKCSLFCMLFHLSFLYQTQVIAFDRPKSSDIFKLI